MLKTDPLVQDILKTLERDFMDLYSQIDKLKLENEKKQITIWQLEAKIEVYQKFVPFAFSSNRITSEVEK